MRRADLADLTAFVAVADNLSFRAAASHIGVTPSALSRTDAAARGAPCGPASGTRCLGTASCRLRDPSPVPVRHNGIAFRDRGTAGSNPAPSSEESVVNLTFGGKGAGCRSWSVQTRIERGPDAPYVELRRARYGARTTKVRWMMTPHLRAASSSGPSPIFRKLRNSEIPEIATIDEISFSFKP